LILPWLPLLAAAAVFLAFLSIATIDWRHRVSDWREDARRLVQNGRPRSVEHLVVGLLAIAAGVWAAALPTAQFPSPAMWLAAAACAGIGHRRGWTVFGAAGLALAGGGLVLLVTHTVSWSWTSVALGAILAAGWTGWLARFWRQQLHGGRAWTTAGRLIPVARNTAIVWLLVAVTAAIAGWRG
jgi:hypothetical protein